MAVLFYMPEKLAMISSTFLSFKWMSLLLLKDNLISAMGIKNYQSKELIHSYLLHEMQSSTAPGSLRLGTVDILGQVILCGRGLSESITGCLGASLTSMAPCQCPIPSSCTNQKCLQTLPRDPIRTKLLPLSHTRHIQLTTEPQPNRND